LVEGGFLSREPTKYYDDLTSQGVSKMQIAIGLPTSGVFDEMTMQVLNSVLTSTSILTEVTKLEIEKSVDPTQTKVLVEAKR
jgi:murein L,D-transpeptidase YcbB/YkuD